MQIQDCEVVMLLTPREVDPLLILHNQLSVSTNLLSTSGCGKTLCYVLPCLAALGQKPSHTISSIIVVPVQTLALQVEQVSYLFIVQVFGFIKYVS